MIDLKRLRKEKWNHTERISSTSFMWAEFYCQRREWQKGFTTRQNRNIRKEIW